MQKTSFPYWFYWDLKAISKCRFIREYLIFPWILYWKFVPCWEPHFMSFLVGNNYIDPWWLFSCRYGAWCRWRQQRRRRRGRPPRNGGDDEGDDGSHRYGRPGSPGDEGPHGLSDGANAFSRRRDQEAVVQGRRGWWTLRCPRRRRRSSSEKTSRWGNDLCLSSVRP